MIAIIAVILIIKIARWRLFDIMIIVMVVAGVVKIVVKKIVIAWWAETI